jgi:hypothetical protein
MKFVCHNPTANDILMVDIADYADKYLDRQWRCALEGSNKFITEPRNDTS